MRRIHRKILATATAEPVPAKVLLRQAGYDPNTYGREAVTYLTRFGLLIRTPDGVRLARPGEAPPACDDGEDVGGEGPRPDLGRLPAQFAGLAAAGESLRASVEYGGCHACLTVGEQPEPAAVALAPHAAPAAAPPPGGRFFTYLEAELVLLLAAGPLEQSGILERLTDERNHSHVKAVLAGLVERGVLEVTRDGYKAKDGVQHLRPAEAAHAAEPPHALLPGENTHWPCRGQLDLEPAVLVRHGKVGVIEDANVAAHPRVRHRPDDHG
jgi:hypothetical protein